MTDDETLMLDPDCRDGKHQSCIGGPCVCECHGPLPTVPAVQPGDLVIRTLTQGERRYLAMHATYAALEQDDPRYWDTDPTTRAETKRRWQEIADSLHPDPWGPPQ